MLQKKLLFVRLILFTVKLYWDVISRAVTTALRKYLYRLNKPKPIPVTLPSDETKERSIVIVGASFAGYFAARLISTSLPPGSPYRVVIIEPHSHFHFTWVLPRFCVVTGHEHKAFIPYGPHLADAPAGAVRWVQDRVAAVERTCVRLRDSGEKVPYEFLVIATGSEAGKGLDGLPSRVGADDKTEGMEMLRGMQRRIVDTQKLVVVGGGAAGVELATDAKAAYPEKNVVLVHSREAVMHRFGPELQAAALEGLKELGVEVILGERVVGEDIEEGFVTLTSGRKVACDFLVNCAGQKPASQLLAEVTPGSINQSGHIRVKPTMQIADETLPNVYACGDVADTGTRNPNSRAAMQQAMIAADNIVLAARGKQPRYNYKRHWAESVIKLTLGLEKSITHFENGNTELLFHGKETDLALMSEGSWKHYGVKPFEDKSEPESSPDIEAAVGKPLK